MSAPDRSQLDFVHSVRAAFRFLADAGFSEVEALPTRVRYLKGDVEIDLCHGRQSFEIGGGVTIAGTRYAMSEILYASAPDLAKNHRNFAATTAAGVATGLQELSTLMQRHGAAALRGDPRFCAELAAQRKRWSQDYALDVLAAQIRPQAQDAFRRRDYAKAAELYAQIRQRLGPAETQKLALARQRAKGSVSRYSGQHGSSCRSVRTLRMIWSSLTLGRRLWASSKCAQLAAVEPGPLPIRRRPRQWCPNQIENRSVNNGDFT